MEPFPFKRHCCITLNDLVQLIEANIDSNIKFMLLDMNEQLFPIDITEDLTQVDDNTAGLVVETNDSWFCINWEKISDNDFIFTVWSARMNSILNFSSSCRYKKQKKIMYQIFLDLPSLPCVCPRSLK
jgi:hypothetical protein